MSRFLLLLSVLALALPAVAAEPELVGVLAVTLEPEVAKELGLSPEQVAQLQGIVDDREMRGMSRAMKVAKLPREEQVAALADFRAESERLGLAVLEAQQVAKLREVAASRDDIALQEKGLTTEGTESTEEGTEKKEEFEDAPAAVEDLVGNGLRPVPAAESAPPSEGRSGDGRLSFNFNQQPWGDVVRWFADQAGLSLVVDQAPPGSLTYRDDRRYAPAEALDVLNGVLLTKGYTLVRKDRMLLVINLEDDVIPPNVVTDVPVEELPARGEYELVRTLVELGDVNATSAADSLLRLVGPQGAVVVLPEARMLQITETAGRIRTMLAVVEAMKRAAAPLAGDAAQLRSYPLGGADAETTLAVLQSLLEGSGTARLAVDDATGSLIALAGETEHQAIAETLKKLQTDGRRVEVIPVTKVDALTAAALVDKLFNPDGKGKDAKRDPNAPVVEADRLTESLLVRGTADQVRQVRELVERLDAPDERATAGARGPVRTLPVTGPELARALEQIETLWPTLRGNPLRVTRPGQGIPSFRPGADVEREMQQEEDPLDLLYGEGEGAPSASTRPAASLFRFANQSEEEAPTEAGETAGEDGPAPIYIAPGPGTTVIASRDVEALDTLESLLATVLDSSTTGGREYAVFYLKFADATTAAALLSSLFGGDSGGGSSLMGDLAGAAIGGSGGDLVGDLLGMGSGSDSVGFSSVSVDVVPDVRLNALYVYATPQDLEVVNRMLRVIDQPRGPDRVESVGVPRLIKLRNTDVSEVATVVRQVFEDRIGAGGGGGGGQPSPQEFLRALQGGEKGADDQEPERMTIGIDERSNSLVVRSSEPLFEEVKTLVEQLDRAGVERPVSTRVVSLRNTGSEALKETLVSLLGDKAVLGAQSGEKTPQQAAAAGGQPGAGQNNNNDNAERQQREMRERIERFRNMQQMFERMREGGGGRGRGGPPGGGQGGGGRGGR